MADHINTSSESGDLPNVPGCEDPGQQVRVVTEYTHPFADAPALLADASRQMSSAERQIDAVLGHLAAARLGLLALLAGPLNGAGLNAARATLDTIRALALEMPDAGLAAEVTQAMRAQINSSDQSVREARDRLARAFACAYPAIGTLKALRDQLQEAGGQIMDASQHVDLALGERRLLAESALLIGPDVHLHPVALELDIPPEPV